MDTAPISCITIGESNSEAAWWDNHGKRALRETGFRLDLVSP